MILPIIGIISGLILVMLIIQWRSERFIAAADACFIVCVLAILVLGMFFAHTIIEQLLALIPILGLITYLWRYYCSSSAAAFYAQRVKQYSKALECDPTNLGAREFLAESLFAMGRIDEAIGHMQYLVGLKDCPQYRHKLEKWIQAKRMLETDNLICRWCRNENDRSLTVCAKCGSDLPYHTKFTRWLTYGKRAKLRFWLIVFGGLSVLCLSIVLLGGQYVIFPLMFGGFAILGWFFICSARR